MINSGWGGGVPADTVAAAVFNVTVTQPTAAGYLTVVPDDQCSEPLASNLNFRAGQTVANQVLATVGSDGKITVYSVQGTDVLVDVVGWFG